MAEQPYRPFKIRRIDKIPAKKAPPPAPSPPVTPEPATAPKKPQTRSAGWFPSPARALAFISALAGAALVEEVGCRRGPQTGWWVELALPPATIVHLVWTAGGRPYTPQGTHWRALALDGELAQPTQANHTLVVSDWPTIELAQLLANTSLRRKRPSPSTQLQVLVPAALSRWVLRRTTALGIDTHLSTVLRRPLVGQAEPSAALLLRLQTEQDGLPPSLIHSLNALPYTVVAQGVGVMPARLLVAVGYQLPLAEDLLSRVVPEGESWLLAGPHFGHWRLQYQGQEIAAEQLLESATQAPPSLPQSQSAQWPQPLAVRLVPNRHDSGKIDAQLLDDTELQWLQTFLAGRPADENSFLLPGPGHHLLLSPGGLAQQIPFGIPLRHWQPGGLYVESGWHFQPKLPTSARPASFELSTESIVVICESGSYRFQKEHLVPAWTLWVGKLPAIETGLGARGEQILASISQALRQREVEKASTLLGKIKARMGKGEAKDQIRWRKQAQKAEWAGDFVVAAQLMEKAGDMGAAGRLYERAADRGGE